MQATLALVRSQNILGSICAYANNRYGATCLISLQHSVCLLWTDTVTGQVLNFNADFRLVNIIEYTSVVDLASENASDIPEVIAR